MPTNYARAGYWYCVYCVCTVYIYDLLISAIYAHTLAATTGSGATTPPHRPYAHTHAHYALAARATDTDNYNYSTCYYMHAL
jgi:hypothetical protein